MLTKWNCNEWVFPDFIDGILRDFLCNHVAGDDSRCLIWDNLGTHKTLYATPTIEDMGTHNHFFSVDRPPYCPKMAPIEYIFVRLHVS